MSRRHPSPYYRLLRDEYNARSPRRHMESFEQCLFSFDDELSEYLDINSAAGLRSNPGQEDVRRMLHMWLTRDENGEPDPGAAEQISAHYRRMGFQPVNGHGNGGHYRGSSTPGPQGAHSSNRHRGMYSPGSHGSDPYGRASNRLNPSSNGMSTPCSRPASRRPPGSQAPTDTSAPRRRGNPPPYSESSGRTSVGGSQRGSSEHPNRQHMFVVDEEDDSE